ALLAGAVLAPWARRVPALGAGGVRGAGAAVVVSAAAAAPRSLLCHPSAFRLSYVLTKAKAGQDKSLQLLFAGAGPVLASFRPRRHRPGGPAGALSPALRPVSGARQPRRRTVPWWRPCRSPPRPAGSFPPPRGRRYGSRAPGGCRNPPPASSWRGSRTPRTSSAWAGTAPDRPRPGRVRRRRPRSGRWWPAHAGAHRRRWRPDRG